MQQTQTYKLNLIDKSDTFSPDPLNDNARKTEQALKDAAAALTAETNARKAADTAEANARAAADTAEANARIAAAAALDQRVKVFEAKKVVLGTYVGTGGQGNSISLGFTPLFVFITGDRSDSNGCVLLTQSNASYETANRRKTAEIVSGGFQIVPVSIPTDNNTLDVRNQNYLYIAYL